MTFHDYIHSFESKTKGRSQSPRTMEINRLALLCHVVPVSVYRWTSGRIEASYIYKEKISENIGIPVDELFPSQE